MPYNPLRMRMKAVEPHLIIGSILVILIFIVLFAYTHIPSFFGAVEYFDRDIALQCAKEYEIFNVNASDCSKFSPGSIAELCGVDYKAFNSVE
jgi:hypothetical protein